MSVARCQEEVSSSEFVEWKKFLDMEESEGFHRQDYFFALLAAEIRRSYVKDPNKVRLKDFLLKFESASTKRKRRSSVEQSKSAWLSAVGWKGNK